jgi:hypothetical protein
MSNMRTACRGALIVMAAASQIAPNWGMVPDALAQPLAGSASSAGAAALLEGVDAIPPVGTVGQVAVWGDDAFAVVLGKDGSGRVPIVGAGTLGLGRVMAWAHGYGSAGAAARLSTGRLLVNSCRWAAGAAATATARVRVALIDSDLAVFLESQGLDAKEIDGGAALSLQLANAHAQVLLCGRADLSDREVEAITQFVRSGGGFVCFACPWGWAQVHRKPVAEIPFNRILAPAGVALADGYAEPTREGAFEASHAPGDEFHVGRALDLLEKAGTNPKSDPLLLLQAGITATNCVAALPRDDRLLRPRLEALLASHAGALVPAPDRPLEAARALDRVLLAAALAEIDSAAPEKVTAHPAAAAFPGAVPADAREVSRRMSIDTAVARWHSTGLYAPPGRVITVGAVGGLSDAGLRVRIGCHTDELWHHAEWRRVPRISRSWPIDSARVRVASAFGGPIYIEVPERGEPGATSIEIAGAVEAPYFVLGKTTDREWATRIRDLPGPWAEWACDSVILSIPSDVAREIDEPTPIMEHWARVLDAVADLAAIPRQRAYPQRYVADVQISAGYMHSGYPIMTHLDAAAFMTDMKGLVDSGWGPYHEMGHNHQDAMWTFEGTGEVTCNVFTLYVLETVCDVAVEDASLEKVTGIEAARARQEYLAEGRRFERWKSDPFLALQMYAQIRLAFGWDVYRKVFAEYRGLAASERPETDDEKRDQWMVRMSRATGRNLGPFFEAWGVPTSAGARDSIRGLPEWMPEEMRAK